MTQVVLPDLGANDFPCRSATKAWDVLQINAKPRRVEENGIPLLVIEGEVRNNSDSVQDLPSHIQIDLSDAAGNVVKSWLERLTGTQLLPAGNVTFSTRIERPSEDATNLRVTFACRDSE